MPSFRLSLGLRPQSLDDFVGMEMLTGKNSLFRKGIESGKLYSSILWGPPGCGKTSFALAACKSLGIEFGYVDCTQADSNDLRAAIRNYTVVVFDEIQYLNKKQQQLLLQATEAQGLSMLGLTTEYPPGQIFEGLLDRCNVYRLPQMSKEQMQLLAIKTCERFGVTYEVEAIEALCYASQSMRGVYNKLEQLFQAHDDVTGENVAKLPGVSLGVDHKSALISALQKSIRGSDPNAAVYYLGQLLKQGEMEYVARRLRVIASEDIGLADSSATTVVDSCVNAAFAVGLPEARIPLSHAVLRLALAPKSNSAMMAVDSAMSAPELHAPSCIASEHAPGYVYPHEYPGHYYPLDYLPKPLQGTEFYHPCGNKWEIAAMQYLNSLKNPKSTEKISDKTGEP